MTGTDTPKEIARAKLSGSSIIALTETVFSQSPNICREMTKR